MEVIYSYTWKDAVRDGMFVDVSEMAKEAGIKYPVAVTRNLHDRHIVPDEEAESWGQSRDGRLWDVLWMFSLAARKGGGSFMTYSVVFADRPGMTQTVLLNAVCEAAGPDDPTPVITIMLPEDR